MTGDTSIAVVGASGHTGRFVVAELQRRNLAAIPITRDNADLDDPHSLDRALSGAGAVINCAGPFLDTAHHVVQAALRNRIHYLDVTAEQASARATLDDFDAGARDAGIAVIPAAGFYGGFGDLLGTAALGDWRGAEEVTIYIALDRWWPTEGTRKTGARNTVPRVVLREGRFVAQPQPPRTTTWTFPAPFGQQAMTEVPLTETVLLARHAGVANVTNFISAAPLNDLRDPSTPPPTRDDAMGRSRQQFFVEAVARREGSERRASARGQDIYAFTAPLVVEAAQRVVDGRASQRGAFAMASAFDAREFLNALEHSYPSLEVEAALT